jgi:hypothetical protein
MKHTLKIYPEYFQEVVSGTKTFEVRKNDRDFKVCDDLILAEYCPVQESFTGNTCVREINYILKGGDFGIEKGFVVIGLQNAPIFLAKKERTKQIEFAYDINLQNLNPRFTENQASKEGITVGIDELLEYLNL